MLRSIWITVSIIIIIVIWYCAQSEDYLPNLIAPFTQIHAILLAILGTGATFTHSHAQTKAKINFSCAIILICLGIYTSVNLYHCNIYPWSLMWIGTAFIILKSSAKAKNSQNKIFELQLQNQTASNCKNQFELQILEEVQSPTPATKSHLKNNILFVIYVLLICFFTYNCHKISEYKSKFPILGHTITMKVPGKHHKATFHYYCSDISNSKYPTIILQHGGGGNLAGFMPLLSQLQQMSIKMCIYDRLGYGRSSKLIPDQSLKTKSEITDLMLSLLLRSDERIIYGGWSAGVELAIAYSYYFPSKVDGLIFMDGYPDYLLLEAIQSNASTIRNPHTLLIADLLRFIQPYGIDLLFGANPISDAKMNEYYEAYYRTGYLWDTQTTELRYMNTTNEISQMGRQSGAILPYPQAKLYLNWPDISKPLLVMPSNNTVSGSNGQQYKVQSQKYLQKCTSKLKRLEIIEGAHDFVLISYQRVAKIIHEFVNEITQQS